MSSTRTIVADRYELLEAISSGGMGQVHRALDHRLGREVAVKFLHRSLAEDPAFVARFEREARAAAGLSHPNLIAVYDFGTSPDGPYLVMELLGDGTLSDLLRERGPLPAEEAVPLLRQIAEGVAAAHAGGVTHRDLKPSNVLLSEDGQPKVADFGLARSAGTGRLTGTGEAVGSVHYLSPEQARGEAAGPPADVYALGAMLFEMVTGRVPFDAPTPVAVAFKHVNEEPPAPSSVRPELPPWLDQTVQRALAKDPAERPADAGELAAELGLVGRTEAADQATLGAFGVAGVVPGDEGLEGAAAASGRRRSRAFVLAVGAVILAILVSGGLILASVLGQPEPATGQPGPVPSIPSASSTPSPSAGADQDEDGGSGSPSASPSSTPSPTPSETASATPTPTETSAAPSPTPSDTGPTVSPTPSPVATDPTAVATSPAPDPSAG